MKSVYLVSQGEYSDYCIVAVFATRELAEQAILRDVPKDKHEGYDFTGQDYGQRIEEFFLLTSLDRVEIWQAGNDIYNKWHARPELVYIEVAGDMEERSWVHYSPLNKKLWAHGRAMTAERAMKIARDAYAKAKAEKAGL